MTVKYDTFSPIDQNARLFRVVKSVKSIKLFTCRACGDNGNRTHHRNIASVFRQALVHVPPIIRLSELSTIAVSIVHYSCQFPISRDLTVGFLVLRTGFEPVPYHRK